MRSRSLDKGGRLGWWSEIHGRLEILGGVKARVLVKGLAG